MPLTPLTATSTFDDYTPATIELLQNHAGFATVQIVQGVLLETGDPLLEYQGVRLKPGESVEVAASVAVNFRTIGAYRGETAYVGRTAK